MRRPVIERNADDRPRVWMKQDVDVILWANHPAAMRRRAKSIDNALFDALDGDISTPAVIIWEGDETTRTRDFSERQ